LLPNELYFDGENASQNLDKNNYDVSGLEELAVIYKEGLNVMLWSNSLKNNLNVSKKSRTNRK
jgi:hypothetical protein